MTVVYPTSTYSLFINNASFIEASRRRTCVKSDSRTGIYDP